MTDARAAKAFTVRGRVQGVGFRWFTQHEAAALGLAGWVANRDDGSVQGEVFGSAEDVTRFLAAVRQGPASSQVQDMTTTDLGADSHAPATFEVRR
jgi:acylphosphatase